MSEMINKVKNAIAEKMAPAIDVRAPYAKVMFEMAARAAIEAMREPTAAMKSVEGIHWGYGCNVCGGLQEGWYAMIDEALK